MTDQEKEEALEHAEIKKSIGAVLSSPHGKRFIKYLFKSFSVGEFPPVGMTDKDLLEYMSYLRAGNSIYKIVLESDPDLTGFLITEIEKERQNAQAKQNAIQSTDG